MTAGRMHPSRIDFMPPCSHGFKNKCYPQIIGSQRFSVEKALRAGLAAARKQLATYDLARCLRCESDQFQPKKGSTKQFGWLQAPATIFASPGRNPGFRPFLFVE